MRVFITGGTGFIGSHIVMKLLSQGDQVTVLARNPNKIAAFVRVPGLTLVAGGMEDINVIRAALPGHDACIHAALYWESEPTELELKDVRTSVALFEAAEAAGVDQLIYTSSTAVHRPFGPGMRETDRLTPADFYAATKAANEAFLSAFAARSKMRCNVVRPGPTVGGPAVPGGPVNTFRDLSELAELARRGDEIQVTAGVGRQFIAAVDLAKLFAALVHAAKNGETYLAVARNVSTWENIAREAIAISGSKSRLSITETESKDEVPWFDPGKIEREFGFQFNAADAITKSLRCLLSTAE